MRQLSQRSANYTQEIQSITAAEVTEIQLQASNKRLAKVSESPNALLNKSTNREQRALFIITCRRRQPLIRRAGLCLNCAY
ncbi:MAG: hypothetical protein ACJAT7_003807 [Psychromonas sp.]|jgi:hypothetical protein|uniref:hypothetical protein n=1 Tax=Psychromonas sp. TaxID=1884585 RepID=UPI0039E3F7DC